MRYLTLLLIAGMISACSTGAGDSASDESSENDYESREDSTASEDTDRSVPTGDNSRVSVDWPGSYAGVVPCADCAGIYNAIDIYEDGTYERVTKYLGKTGEAQQESGTIEWNDDGGTITLSGSDIEYLVGENVLIQRDIEGNSITGDLAARYRIEKTAQRLTDRYWKLIEVRGQAIPEPEDPKMEPFIMLLSDSVQAAFGFSGCNSFRGNYEQDGLRLSFSTMASTMRACMNVEYEQLLMQALEATDNYALNAGGDTLSINRARMAPLARFAAAKPK